MRVTTFSVLATLLFAPLGAEAAAKPARFAVTLRATVVDSVEYKEVQSTEDCTARRTGTGGRTLTLESLRPSIVQVHTGRGGAAYRPLRLSNVRAVAIEHGGTSLLMRACRFLPPERSQSFCRAPGPLTRTITVALARRGANRIGFRPALRGAIHPCQLSNAQPIGGWLDAAVGRVREALLIAGRSRRVTASGTSTQTANARGVVTMDATAKTAVHWTLTFQPLG